MIIEACFPHGRKQHGIYTSLELTSVSAQSTMFSNQLSDTVSGIIPVFLLAMSASNPTGQVFDNLCSLHPRPLRVWYADLPVIDYCGGGDWSLGELKANVLRAHPCRM